MLSIWIRASGLLGLFNKVYHKTYFVISHRIAWTIIFMCHYKSRIVKALNLVSIKRENSLSMIELHPSNTGTNDHETTLNDTSYCIQYTSGRSPRMPTNHGNKCRWFVLRCFWLVKITSSTLKLARTSKFYPFYIQTRWKFVLTVSRVTARFAKWNPSGNDETASNLSYFMKS